MAVGDVYEVTDVQNIEGQQVLNVYFYQQRAAFAPAGVSIAQALSDAWEEDIVPLLIVSQFSTLSHIEVRCRNLFNDADQGLTVSGQVGTGDAVGQSMPTFNAYGLTMNTDNAAVRPGAKRIAGVPEGASTNGVLTAGEIGRLNTLATALETPISGGLIIEDDIMFPVVVQRVRSGSSGSYEYRLPENSGELVFGTIIEILVKLLVTSQISRKIGLGV